MGAKKITHSWPTTVKATCVCVLLACVHVCVCVCAATKWHIGGLMMAPRLAARCLCVLILMIVALYIKLYASLNISTYQPPSRWS
jgi:hypothetical protein